MTRDPSGRNRALVLVALAALAVAACDRAPRRHTVDIGDMTYAPVTLGVATGDTVVWTNRDIVPHTVTFTGGDSTSDHLDAGATFVMVARDPGTVEYRCRYHPSMTATLSVR